MSWKKHFSVVKTGSSVSINNSLSSNTEGGISAGSSSKYASYLPEVYAGHPNRIQRYYQYEDMDRDSDINAALDTIADFCTQSEEQNDEPFEVVYNEEATETEVTLIKTNLKLWTKLNEFKQRLWHVFRQTMKNGDQFFLRDPETAEWLWIDHFSVEMVKVDDTAGKEPDEYIIRGLDLNRQAKFATKSADPSQYRTPFGTSLVPGSRPQMSPGGQASANNVFQLAGGNRDPRAQQGMVANELSVVDAANVIHLSLSVGMDINWPFGQSILEPVFKTYKQKELLEDSIIIYRVSRAPERRIFYIDVGNMPPLRAKSHIEQIKNEIHQRRIPNRTGGGNSILDAAYNPLCLKMDTRIPLLDGRTLSLYELTEEYKSGKENWVYSCDPITGKIVPGNITWAGVTKKSAKVIKITLDNGETLTCTPDHKIPVLGKGFVEAQNLTIEDSLVAFYTREKNIDRKLSNERTYTQVYDHDSKKWIYVHRMVGEFFRNINKHQQFTFLPENISETKTVIHHKDYNRYNNDPRNLAFMGFTDHRDYHIFNKKDYWNNLSEEESVRVKTKISNSLKEYYANFSEEDKKKFSELSSIRNSKWMADKKINNPESFSEWRNKIGKANSEYFKANPQAGKDRIHKAIANRKVSHKNQTLIVSQKMVQTIVDIVKTQNTGRIETASMLSIDSNFINEMREVNPIQENMNCRIDFDKISPMKLDSIIEKAGYSGWRDFTRKVANYNHRVSNIEWLDDEIEVGTITVDGKERWHNYHTFAIESGIFVKNSIMDDYFFAQSSEGRGSKVETLPGGDNLGEIGDLTFFSKKMARALRIPASYLALGGDTDQGGGASYNDGKLGAAVIQEFRFNKYCMRLQSLLAPMFDKDFKKFLKQNGIEIDSSLFELRFNPPQNFTKYRQIEIDAQQVQVYQQVADNKKLSERFKFKRFLNLSEEELIENERMWAEENAGKLKKSTGATPAESEPESDLSSVGIRLPDQGLGMEPEPDMGEVEGETPPEGGAAGGAAPPPPAEAPPV